ncbi:MAG: hypothetical protein IJA32_02060 [Lachnospiraceae bacterium]|nr:hypothetical protein [Lachnospiraceae bacterium]
MYQEMIELIQDADKVLIGLGGELKLNDIEADMSLEQIKHHLSAISGKEYEIIEKLVEKKDYFIISSNVDGGLTCSGFEENRWVAPMGNPFIFQCVEEDCDGLKDFTKDKETLWKEEKVLCPKCGKEMKANIRQKEHPELYNEIGYLPQWEKYQKWLSCTLNRKLVVLELGEGFECPALFRWPFEKTVFFHQKAKLIRVNEKLWQIGEEIKERAISVPVNAKVFLAECEKLICEK